MNIPVVWSAKTREHDPRAEVWVGVPTVGTEVAERVDSILDALGDHPLIELADPLDESSSGGWLSTVAQVHDHALVEHLQTAYPRWQAGSYLDEVGQDRVVPYLFPTPAFTAAMPWTEPHAIHAQAGRFGYDTMTLLGPGSWAAIAAAAACAYHAAELVGSGEYDAAYALARPPGHHATPAGYGGSCYLNNAAVAAQQLRNLGHQRVAVIDLDAHHGNGTQAIFWERSDVFYGSTHIDPGLGWFPHYYGFATEVGVGEGAHATFNVPLPEGAGDEPWLVAVGQLAEFAADCDALVVSLGVDAAVDDPESPLQVTAAGYQGAGELLGRLGKPSVVVQEGGYHLPTLGALVGAYLAGHG